MSSTRRDGRRRSTLAAAMGGVLLTACGAGPSFIASGKPPEAAPETGGEQMPVAPRGESAWLAAVDRAYARAGDGRGAEAWLRQRMSHRLPGERLAVLMGVDDVILQTHFAGVDTLVPRSARFARRAHALGYSVFYVTNRSGAGLGRVEAVLRAADVPANTVYGRPVGAVDEESAKAQVRSSIREQGYTLAMVVAASEASFDGTPSPEREVRLPDLALRA